MEAFELAIHRQNTDAFIAAKPSTIVLTPSKRERTTGGGFKDIDQEPRDPQTLRIIELGMTATAPVVTDTDGKQREVEFWLLGGYGASIEVGDWWTSEDDREWKVSEVVRSNGYEVRAVVTERGK